MIPKRRPVITMIFFATIVCIVTSLPASMNMPLVDPGLFVISGVKTCGDTFGYCLLGSDCTTDDDFLPDPTGNCDGLKRAFTPSAPFICCKFNKISPPQPGTSNMDIDITKSAYPELKDKISQLQPGMLKIGTDIKKNAYSGVKDKISRNSKEDVNFSEMDIGQLARLSQIESVIKKIVEQLINETANNIQVEETSIDNETKIDENTVRNEEFPINNDTVEINETTMSPTTEADETFNYESTYIPLENKEETAETNKINSFEAETQDSFIDDEFRAEKHICQKTCKSEIIFSVEKKPLCYGTLLDDIWILTSGTCASRLNKADIRKVTVTRRDQLGSLLNISNILVHENFKSPASKNSPENNDLALISLTEPLDEPECIPCFNQKKNITNETCKSFQNTNFKNSIKSHFQSENCEGQVKLRNLVSNSYLILPCNRWRMQYNQEGRLGSGLWCDGKLAGVQTGVGVGSLIYTPVNEYAMWISDNKRIERR